MGDLSVEPSMEEILSSIKRIIAEEGDAPVRARRGARAGVPSPAALAAAVDEVLELSDPMPATPAAAELTRRAEARSLSQSIATPPDPVVAPPPAPPPPAPPPAPAPAADEPAPAPRAEPAVAVSSDPDPSPEPIASRRTLDASRGSLDALSRMLVKPEPGSDGTLEGMVREMLRPMLGDWLDRNLPALVEEMVAREIARISQPRP